MEGAEALNEAVALSLRYMAMSFDSQAEILRGQAAALREEAELIEAGGQRDGPIKLRVVEDDDEGEQEVTGRVVEEAAGEMLHALVELHRPPRRGSSRVNGALLSVIADNAGVDSEETAKAAMNLLVDRDLATSRLTGEARYFMPLAAGYALVAEGGAVDA